MISLAANGSPILKALLDAGDLPLDYVKCPLSGNSREEVATFRALRPVLLHGWGPAYWIGQRDVPRPDLLRDLMALSSSPYVSTHLDAQAGDFDEEPTPAQVLVRVQANVAALCEVAGAGVLLENVPYLGVGKSPRFITDPAFITEALSISGAGFLLDLAHAQVSAHRRGESFLHYLGALPLAETVELHLSRPSREAGVMRDRHLSLEEDDYSFLSNLLPRLPRLQTVALEYGGLSDSVGDDVTVSRNDSNALRAQISRLHEILKNDHAAGK